MGSFKSFSDVGSKVTATISYKVGLFNKSWLLLLTRLLHMFVIYFNFIVSVAINERKQSVVEFRGVLCSFMLSILLFIPTFRKLFTTYLQSNSGKQLTGLPNLIYSITGTYFFSKLSNYFKFTNPDFPWIVLFSHFLVTLRSFINDEKLVSNFTLGRRFLIDTLLLIDLFLTMLRDPVFDEHNMDGLLDILVDTPVSLWANLGQTLFVCTGDGSQKTISCYALCFFDSVIFYIDGTANELQYLFVCIVFELESTVCIKLAYVLRCLSPWDARLRPNYNWDIYWCSLVSFVCNGSFDINFTSFVTFNPFSHLDKLIQSCIDESDSKLIPSDNQIDAENDSTSPDGDVKPSDSSTPESGDGDKPPEPS